MAAAKLDLALKAVAEMEGIEVDDDEIDAEIARLAEKTGKKAAAMRRELDGAGQLPAVRSDSGSQRPWNGSSARPSTSTRRGKPSTARYLFPPDEADAEPEAAEQRRKLQQQSRSEEEVQ